MPAALLTVLRWLFIAVVQTGAIVAVQQALEGVVDYIRSALKTDGGLTDAETDDVLLNETLDALAILGITVAALKSKIPIRLADKLGLKASLPTKVSLSLKQTAAVSRATSTGALRSQLLKTFLLGLAGSLPVSLLFFPTLVQNLADQAAFAPKQANDFYQSFFGFRPFPEPLSSSGPAPASYTATEFVELYRQLELAGVVGINSTVAQQSQLLTQNNLAQLINYIAGANITAGKKSDKTAIRSELSKYLITKSGSTAGAVSPAASGGVQTAPSSAPAVQQIKIYTGVVAGGTLGTPTEFIARPDDMINSADELKAAAKNNLASFVTALPGRFYYEIGIVNSVKTRGGFTQKGEAVRIISGYYQNGTPRYKTVYHKFAVLKIGVTDENGRQIKLGTITLGPVNVVDYQPTALQLKDIEQSITPELFTNNIADIQEIISPAPIGVLTSAGSNPNPPVSGSTSMAPQATGTPPPGKSLFQASNVSFFIPSGGSIFIPTRPQGIAPTVYARSGDVVRLLPLQNIIPTFPQNGLVYFKDRTGASVPIQNVGQVWDESIYLFEKATGLKYYDLPQQNIADVESAFLRSNLSSLPNQMRSFEGPTALRDFVTFLGALLPGGNVDITGGGLTLNDAARAATTLGAFFAALGKPLPGIAERALTYESLGLGAKSTYTGTAEQNNRLLAVLKAQS